MEENIAKFFTNLGLVFLDDCRGEFIDLLNRILAQALKSLFSIPRTFLAVGKTLPV